jgi:hypothetical protein
VSTGAFDAALLGAGRTLLRQQTALGGGQLALAPRFLVVPWSGMSSTLMTSLAR